MLELNIVTEVAKPQPKKAPKQAAHKSPPEPPVIQSESGSALGGGTAETVHTQPIPRKRKKAVVQIEPAAPPEPQAVPQPTNATDTSAPPPKEAKRTRYAPAPGAADKSLERKREDPQRAAALPSTLPLNAPRPSATTFSATTFGKLPIDSYLSRHLSERMYLTNLTPVQQHAIPSLLTGGDLLIRSPTGSGKTLAYAVPIVQALVAKGPSVITRAAGTFAIVLVPTRELCMQTHEVVERLTNPFPWLVTSQLMGGEKRKAEKARLRKGVALLVGTPGRVADHAEATSAWKLDHCQHLVLDEADRLLDLGFQKSVDTILQALDLKGGISNLDRSRAAPSATTRQTVLLSATLSKGLRELAGRSLTDYATLNITTKGAELTPSPSQRGGKSNASATETVALGGVAGDGKDVEGDAEATEHDGAAGEAFGGDEKLDVPSGLVQSYALVPTRHRLTALMALIRSRCAPPAKTSSGEGAEGACKMIVFVSSCDEVDFLYELLAVSGEWPDKHKAALATGHADEVRAAIKDFKKNGQGREHFQFDEAEDDEDDEGDGVAGFKRKRPGSGSGTKAARITGDGLSFECALLGTTVLRLHGQMSQRDRTQAFVRFRRLTSGVMFATDVAARGLNLEGVHWIVQHDLPQDAKEYLHRAGRTARLGQRGHAVLMLHPSELPFLSLLREAGVSTLKELKFASLQAALCPGGGRKDVYVVEVALQQQLEAAVRERFFMAERAAAAYQSYLRGYAAMPKAVRQCVHVGQLHLGHLAKSFGLLEPPSRLAAQQSKRALLGAGKQGSEYLAGAEYQSRQVREAQDKAKGDKAKGKHKKPMSLNERVRKQPKGNAQRPVGTPSMVSEFGSG